MGCKEAGRLRGDHFDNVALIPEACFAQSSHHREIQRNLLVGFHQKDRILQVAIYVSEPDS